MINCHYHPVKDAVYHCHTCDIDCCDQCVNEGEYAQEPRCFKCNSQLVRTKQATINKPFWRRLQESFRYPLDIKTLGVIAAFVIIVGLLPSLPFTFLINLIVFLVVFGASFNYLFTCVRHTAMGHFEPPNALEAVEGGFNLALKVIGLIFALLYVEYLLFTYINFQLAMVATFAIVILLPAIIMVLALTESLLQALNPVNVIKVASKLGLQYLVFLGFIFVMMGSAEVLSSVVEAVFAPLASFLSACIGLYYSIVAFHIMGYMIYENQGELLGQTGDYSESSDKSRTHAQRSLIKANMYIKEGLFDQAVATFEQGVKESVDDYVLNTKYFDFLVACQASEQLSKFGGHYLNLLVKTHRNERIYTAYSSIIKISGAFQINRLENKLTIARACYERGNNVQCVKLLNGIQNIHKNDPLLVDAFQLLHDALIFIPGQEATGKKVREHLKVLISKQRGQDHLVDRRGLEDTMRSTEVKNTNETMRNQSSSALDGTIAVTKEDVNLARIDLSKKLKVRPRGYGDTQEDVNAPLTLDDELLDGNIEVSSSPLEFADKTPEPETKKEEKPASQYHNDYSAIEFD